MGKKVAVIAVNPVNGLGLFEYLESFFENGITYQVYAMDKSKNIKTNSGLSITLDGVVADLKGKENEFDAVVFACGDAMPQFAEIAGEDYVADTFEILAKFNSLNKMLIGHCAAAIMFDNAGVADGKKLAVHPFGKAAINKGIGTDDPYTIDKNIYTAQCENTIAQLMPILLDALK